MLVSVAVAIFYLMLGWIRHNRALARNGNRGLSTRYLHPFFMRDWFDRLLVFRSRLPLRGRWFVIRGAESEKRYSPQTFVEPKAIRPPPAA